MKKILFVLIFLLCINVKASIVSAVEAVTGLAVHKIQVFEMGGK